MNAVTELPVAKPNCFGLSLPHGIGSNYAVPYIVCRGVMAGMIYTGKAKHLRRVFAEKTEIARWDDVVVYQTAGSRLDQKSADLYLELAQIALAQDYAPKQRIVVEISADKLTARLGWGRGGQQRVSLHEQVSYLKDASFRYDLPGLCGWQCSFVSDIKTDMSTRDIKAPSHYTIELNASMLQVYAEGSKILSGKIRRQLRGKPLATALHAFYATHDGAPFDYGSATLKRIMSREATVEGDWRTELDAALAAIEAATGWTCKYNRKTGLVAVRKAKPVAEAEPPKDPAPDASKAPQDTPTVEPEYDEDDLSPTADPSFAAREAIRSLTDILKLRAVPDLLALLGGADRAEYAEYLDRKVNYQRRANHHVDWLRDRAALAWAQHQRDHHNFDPFGDI